MKYWIEYCKLALYKIRLYIWFRARGLPQASVLKKSGLLKVHPQKNPMSSEQFQETMLKLAKPTGEFQVSEGADGPLAVTKVAGAPWWPQGVPRPRCSHGHEMAFVAQILLSDVPLNDMPENALLSFHYCDRCSQDGGTSFGCFDTENRGYDLTILYDVDKAKVDMKGLTAPSITKSYSISFRDVEEVPGMLAEDAGIKHDNLPIDFPQGHGDLEEDIYPGLKHISNSKIGGWPSWVQYPEWPSNSGKRYKFLGQLDWKLFDGAPWCTGGYAYLFITEDENGKLKCEMSIQVT
jgi:uncharacterized protein YwqG